MKATTLVLGVPQMAVRVDLLVSLDGFATTTDKTPDNPFGPDWSRLVDAYVATRTFRERVLKDTSGKGTTGMDLEASAGLSNGCSSCCQCLETFPFQQAQLRG